MRQDPTDWLRTGYGLALSRQLTVSAWQAPGNAAMRQGGRAAGGRAAGRQAAGRQAAGRQAAGRQAAGSYELATDWQACGNGQPAAYAGPYGRKQTGIGKQGVRPEWPQMGAYGQGLATLARFKRQLTNGPTNGPHRKPSKRFPMKRNSRGKG